MSELGPAASPSTESRLADAPKFLVETFGCQMNVHDSTRMEEALVAHGWVAAQGHDDADLIVFNTCSVREKAEQKLRSEIGRLKPLKAQRPGLVIAIAGCVAQQEGDALLARLPHVDLIVGPDNLGELPMLAETIRLGGPPVARTVFDLDAPAFLHAAPKLPGRTTPVSAFVTTMKGCDERCSFCIVPYTRGPERYRPLREIVDECARLVDAGVREIMLLGQTVNSWLPPEEYAALPAAGDDSPAQRARGDESAFATLLRAIAREVPGLRRLRYASPHPRHVTPDLIAAHAELDVLARHVHLPVQSGSDRMLKRMIRRYRREEYVARAAALKASRPGLTLSTDVIVGFPGETDDDFEQTLSLVREVGFIALFGFKFSPRPYTPALKLADDVPEPLKAERLARLFAEVERQQQAHLASLVGSDVDVLFEGPSSPNEKEGRVTSFAKMMGRSERNEIVHVDVPAGRDGAALVGQVVRLRVARANAHSLGGELDATTTLSLPALPEPAATALGAAGAPPERGPEVRRLQVLGG
jgi:tRNA-2-methylthio-N6-dimethylallyladenosine synthase